MNIDLKGYVLWMTMIPIICLLFMVLSRGEEIIDAYIHSYTGECISEEEQDVN